MQKALGQLAEKEKEIKQFNQFKKSKTELCDDITQLTEEMKDDL